MESRPSPPARDYLVVVPPGGGEPSRPLSSVAQLEDLGVQVQASLPLIGGYTAALDERAVRRLESLGFTLFPDEPARFLPTLPSEVGDPALEEVAESGRRAAPLEPRPALQAPRFVSPLTERFQGEGVTIAVLDTGLYPHPDFTSPQNRIVGWLDTVHGRTVPYDDHGHGTHVAGDAAGSGRESGGLFRGTAPRAALVGVKVLDGDGSGRTSDIVRGLEWALEHKDRLNIRVVNMSLGRPAHRSARQDPIDQAVRRCVEAGIVVVAAAGNEGPGRRTIQAPGDSPHALTVGAVDDRNTPDPADDRVAPFSSRGPTRAGLSKPDLVAPGEAILAPCAPGSVSELSALRHQTLHGASKWLASMSHPQLREVPDSQWELLGLGKEAVSRIREGEVSARAELDRLLESTSRTPLVGTSYIGMPGTSMAAPIVAGVVAQMLEANPSLTPAEIKEILTSTADRLPRVGRHTQGAGMVDPEEAISQALLRGGMDPLALETLRRPAGAAQAGPPRAC